MSDQLIRAISQDGLIKVSAVSTRDLTERARQIHKTVHLIGADLLFLGKEGPPDAEALLRLVHVELPVHPPELVGGVHVEEEQALTGDLTDKPPRLNEDRWQFQCC